MLQRMAREDFGAVLAFGRQLRDSLLDGQVARGRGLGDLHATVGAGGCLVAQPRVGQEVREARRAHQVPVATLQGEHSSADDLGCSDQSATDILR